MTFANITTPRINAATLKTITRAFTLTSCYRQPCCIANDVKYRFNMHNVLPPVYFHPKRMDI